MCRINYIHLRIGLLFYLWLFRKYGKIKMCWKSSWKDIILNGHSGFTAASASNCTLNIVPKDGLPRQSDLYALLRQCTGLHENNFKFLHLKIVSWGLPSGTYIPTNGNVTFWLWIVYTLNPMSPIYSKIFYRKCDWRMAILNKVIFSFCYMCYFKIIFLLWILSMLPL